MSSTGIQLIIRKYGYQAKISKLYPHALRHTFCKNLVNAEVSLEKIALLAGHDSLETTRRYCEPSQKDLQDAVELIGEEE